VGPGQVVARGDRLTEGPVAPADLLRLLGFEACATWLLAGLRACYEGLGVPLDDRHLEVILRQTFTRRKGRVKVVGPGDSSCEAGQRVEEADFEAEVARFRAEGLVPPRGKRARGRDRLVGVTKAGRRPDSFLAAAVRQGGRRVLVEAALAGRV